MRRLLVASGLAVVMVFAGAVLAADRSQASARTIAHEIFKLSNNLNSAGADLNEMVISMLNVKNIDDVEYGAASQIINDASTIESFADTYMLITIIYSLMVHEEDKAIVLGYLRLHHKRVGNIFKLVFTGINRQLPRLRTPALVSQSERIRDNIRQIEEKIQSWMP